MVIENTNMEAIVVDPYLPSDQASVEPHFDENHVHYVGAGAEAFINLTIYPQWWQQNYDQVLLKEVVHHLNPTDRVSIFKALYNGFHPVQDEDVALPRVLIITRPQYDIDYPMWPEARTVWAKNQPSLEDLVGDLQAAGFRSVDSSVEAYSCQVEMETWLKMVRSRFWSTFSHFSDDELESGCQWIQTHVGSLSTHVNANGEMTTKQDKQIEFEDRLLFIRAYL
jgi:hypothetical protein